MPLPLVALVALVGFTSCSDDPTTGGTEEPATTSPVTISAVTTGAAADDLAAFERDTITVDGEQMTVAVADTPTLRAQGLMGVTDLVGVDGMLFVFEQDVEIGFWMKDTLIPLDIWFFDADGGFVDTLTMSPCTEDPCERYRPSGPYRYALETEVGSIPPGAQPDLGL